VGPNGSGKSTLVRGLLRLMPPSAGQLSFASDLKPCQVGYLPQQAAISRGFPASVREVALSGRLGRRGLKPFYSRADRAAAEECLALFRAADLARRNFGELSGGQQQRVLLARALCAAEKLLILDEPAAGLDWALQGELEQIIARVNRERDVTVVMVSHDVQSALANAGLILHLDTEQRFFGTPEAYRASGVGDGFLGCFHEGSLPAAPRGAAPRDTPAPRGAAPHDTPAARDTHPPHDTPAPRGGGHHA
jgi:zinc transport system ATP-binding protein